MVRNAPMTTKWGWALAAAFLAVVPVGFQARAAQSGDRLGAVVAARIDLQRQLGDWLSSSLARPAEPYRVEAAVRLELRGVVREIRAKQANVTPSVKIGGKNKVKLPGLGMVDGGGAQGNLLPEIAIDGGTKITESVSHQIETEVVKMTVLLFVDPVMPRERRDLLVRLATELAGVDRARGDEVVIEERPNPAPQAAGASGVPTVVQATIQPPANLPWEVIAGCATVLLAAAILAWGLSRRGSDGRIGGPAGRDSGPGGVGAAPAATTEAAKAEAAERTRRREELGAFKALAGATPKEIVQVVAEADPHTAAAIADLFGLDGEAAALLERMVPAQRRAEIGIGLASARVISRDQLAQMESVADQLLKRVRNRVQLGGPGRLAELLAVAPSAVRREMLEVVSSRDPNVAEAARRSIVLFEDLPGLDDASVRQIVASVDPSTVAVALLGAPDVREVVVGAVSKRLRGVLEAEEEAVGEKDAREVEAARRTIEDAMRVLNGRGDLRSRAA